jgi:hypothetical protein
MEENSEPDEPIEAKEEASGGNEILLPGGPRRVVPTGDQQTEADAPPTLQDDDRVVSDEPLLVTVAQPGDEDKKRFKVAILGIVATLKTVYANDPTDAVKKVGANFGTHAGERGPAPFAMVANEMIPGAKEPDFIQQWMFMYHRMMHNANEASKIQVPKLVLPGVDGGE